MNILQSALLAITSAAAIVGTVASANALAPLKEDTRSSIQSFASDEHDEVVTQLIIKPRVQPGSVLAASLDAKNALALSQAALVGMSVVRPMSNNAHVVKLDQPVKLSDAKVIAARLMKYSDIEYAEPDLLMRPFTVPPNDEFYSKQWHYHAPAGLNKGGANLPGLWNTNKGGGDITIAVLDTGILTHADLKPEAVLQGYDFISDPKIANDGDGRDANATDPGDAVAADECGAKSAAADSSWHGTHVAGTIVATMNNSVGVTGIVPGVRVLPLRVLGKCGGYASDVVDAMRWAAGISVTGVPNNSKPAHVLNLSLGSKGLCSTTYQNAVNDVVAAGKVIIAAAGNDGVTKVSQPANCTGVIAVTAHAIDGDKAHYANTGPEVAISAPGGGCGTISAATPGLCDPKVNGLGVLSLFNTGKTGPDADEYAFYKGTSMAGPHVSGVVGLILSVNSTLTPAKIRSILQSSARPHPELMSCTTSFVGTCGAGLLDASKAYEFISAPAVTIQPYSQVVAPNSVVTLSGSVVLSSGRSVKSYAWTQLSGTSVGAINNPTPDTASFTAGTTGVTTFQLMVTDSKDQTGKATAIVRVNSPPVLKAISTQSLKVGASFRVEASDVDQDKLVFHAVSLPPGASFSTSGEFDSSGMAAGTYTLTYYANDGYENSATGAVEIVVAAPASSSSGGGGSMGGSALMWLAAVVGGLRVRRMLTKTE